MITLLILLNVTHWLADYTHLSRPYMLAAKRFGSPVAPIFHHAFIHTILTAIVCSFFADGNTVGVAMLIMLSTHTAIDVWKGKMNVWFPSLTNPANVFHWWVFGLDQLLHQSVIIAIAAICS